MKLRLANTEETTRYYYEELDDEGNVVEGSRDEETWIDLQGQLTKKQANKILRFAPREDGDIDAGLRFLEAAFKDLIKGWSLFDEDGIMIHPTVQVYEQLDASAASWIDRVVGKHLRKAFNSDAADAEKKPSE